MEQGGVVAEPAPQTKVQDLTGQINGVIDTMKRNMGLLLERKVNDLLEKSKEMEDGAKQFKQMSQKVDRFYWCKNVKMIVVIVVVVLIIVLIIILLATGVIPVSAPVPPVVTPTSKP
ncbi:vesicle-associated membrane protein 8-like [Chelmon rostratus]|uniref:vesicle-associated membrane protein 8-like n=1 Tax=Chelmon rostratus TaxID=109905 RepID=UPI001BE8B046|nr:vesicle-associated membrane protein 8-like [Chelmon rostratus]